MHIINLRYTIEVTYYKGWIGMQEQQRVLNLTRSYNLRELGGYPTVDGKTVKMA